MLSEGETPQKRGENMELYPIVFEQDGRALTTSREIADYFGKAHKDILRAIRDTLEQLEQTPEGAEFSGRNFAPAEYKDEQGKPRPAYVLTRDGFTLLAMGFTGAKAMQFKVAYINAFNRMSGIITAAQGALKQAEQRATISNAATSANISGETAIFLKAIEQATQSGEYVIVGRYAQSYHGKLLGAYTSDQIRLYAETAYKLYTALSEAPLTRPKLYKALADDGVAEPHRHKPRAIKGIKASGIYLYRDNEEATAGIVLAK